MKRGKPLRHDPVKAAERRERRETRRATEPPRPEDIAREARRKARETRRQTRVPPKRAAPSVATKRRPISEASPEQRAAIKARPCLVDASHRGKSHPAHLIPRGLLTEGQEDARAVVPLCPTCHHLYDEGGLDLLPFLEPRARIELAFAVERFGLLSTLRRVTNERQGG